jgi:3-oxoacyl-[acyl-carrier protein] reductase
MEERAKVGAFKRAQEPTDLVGTFVYLAADASAFVTGQTIVVDGGQTLPELPL